MDLGLEGRSYVVTGGSRGLGFATAQALAADGAHVLVAARNPGVLAAAVGRLGAGARGVSIDLAKDTAAPQLAQEAALHMSSVDGLVVNVGGPPPGRTLDLDDEDWLRAFESVTLASIRVIRAMSPLMAPDSSILVILSTTVREPIPELATSNVLRPGLAMMVKDLSRSMATRGVRVNGILPGRIDTERMAVLTSDPESRRAMEGEIPLARLGRPAEFGRVAAFLLSPAASYVTGALVPVDGGILHSAW